MDNFSNEMNNCLHSNIICLNQYELIRKYRCVDCGAVVMCACDEAIGQRFLSHQLSHGTELETQQRIPVTDGFKPNICLECQGLPAVAHPVAEIYGRSSKIKRYYWREIAYREMELFGDWLDKGGTEHGDGADQAREVFGKQALTEIKTNHENRPKYSYSELSQAEIIERCGVDMLHLKGVHTQTAALKGVGIIDGDNTVSPECFAIRYFERLGYKALQVESSPFHVLFGVFTFLLIQDRSDPQLRLVGFGRSLTRGDSNDGFVNTFLPQDFGTPGYGNRRSVEIADHFSPEKFDLDDLEALFDYWLSGSEDLRKYLWAHEEKDIQTARNILRILPAEIVRSIVQYLTENYWHRYCGWPDLLVHRDNEYFFAEVKSSKDKLSEDQKHWITGNFENLNLPFKLVKISNIRT